MTITVKRHESVGVLFIVARGLPSDRLDWLSKTLITEETSTDSILFCAGGKADHTVGGAVIEQPLALEPNQAVGDRRVGSESLFLPVMFRVEERLLLVFQDGRQVVAVDQGLAERPGAKGCVPPLDH